MSRPIILVTGATGQQGGATLAALLDAKADVELRFLTRNPASAAARKWADRGAKPVKGDMFDSDSLEAALRQVERAFLVTDFRQGDKEEDQGKLFVRAAKTAGVKHLVMTSVCDAEKAKNVPHFQTKAKVEDELKASGLKYTILRPAWFMDNLPTQPGFGRFIAFGMSYAMLGFKSLKMVAVDDIGAIASKALLNPDAPEFKNQSLDLASGDYSLDDVRKAFTRAQGAEPWFATYVPKSTRWAVGQAGKLGHDMKCMFEFLESPGYSPVDFDKLKKIHPGLLSFQDWVQKKSKSP